MDDRIRAEHMLIAARDAAQMITGRSRADLNSDTMLRRAIVNAVQEIGEAAGRVSTSGRARLSGVDWNQIVGMRHRLVHGYDQINLDIVWKVAIEEAPALIALLENAFVTWPMPEMPNE